MVYACHILGSSTQRKSSGFAIKIARVGLAFWPVASDRWNARSFSRRREGFRKNARFSYQRGSTQERGARPETARRDRRSQRYEQTRMGSDRERLVPETVGCHLESFAGS